MSPHSKNTQCVKIKLGNLNWDATQRFINLTNVRLVRTLPMIKHNSTCVVPPSPSGLATVNIKTGKLMPKYLIHGSYTADGLKGLAKDKASGRKAAVQAAMKGLKCKVESFYFMFGCDDVVLIVDAPDNVAVAAMSHHVGTSGLVKLRTTPLLTVEEVDRALELRTNYRGPGQ
jgi:uncharacterized protein with GYD domain